MDGTGSETPYPRLLRRVRAVLIDTVIIVTVFFSWAVSLPLLGGAHYLMKIAALILPLLILEPGLVAFSGGTVGHHLMGLRIRDASRDRNIDLVRATGRAVIKALFGWLSFVLILVTRKHQALHDYATSTVVVLRHPETLPAHEKFGIRIEDATRYIYPSKARRIAVVVLHNLLAFVLLSVLNALLLSRNCVIYEQCSSQDKAIGALLGTLWLFGICASIVLGWRGLLYGCRRSPVVEQHPHGS